MLLMYKLTNLQLIEQSLFLQLCSILTGDAEIPASKDLVAKTLKAILILNQIMFEPGGRPSKEENTQDHISSHKCYFL